MTPMRSKRIWPGMMASHGKRGTRLTTPMASTEPATATSTPAIRAKVARLEFAQQHPQQHKDGRKILQDDGRGNAGALDGEVIGVVAGGDPENAQNGEDADLRSFDAQAGTAARKVEHGKKNTGGQGRAALRQHQRGHKRNHGSEEVEASGEHGAAEVGGDAKEERGGGNAKIADDGRGFELHASAHSTYSISAVMAAVGASMRETGQYFPLARRTASSIAFGETLRLTR